MNIFSVYRVFQSYFRPRRIARLRRDLPILNDPSATILDVGGVAAWWHEVSPATKNITIINTVGTVREGAESAGFRFEVADGRNLPFQRHEFDLVLSNSVIEHVGNFDDQRRFASEMIRCGKAIYMQTPNRWFPVEPHLISVFIHWFPFRILRRLVRWFSVWGWMQRPTQDEVDEFLRDIRLLSAPEVDKLFPGLARSDEKFLGLTKSFVAYRIRAE